MKWSVEDTEAWGVRLRHREWVREFTAIHGRSPRVLGIGNIANNGFRNALVLREAGVECDVLCYNYFHIMGCPEWELAAFDSSCIDAFKPRWSSIELAGYERPRWFAQGMHGTAIDYLIAYREGSTKAEELWLKLAEERDNPFQDSGTQIFRGTADAESIKRAIAQVLGAFNREDRPGLSDLTLDELLKNYYFVFVELPRIRRLFACYDVIIGYATDGFFSLAAGKRPYIAYEHGTIRAIPFQDDATGKLCALTYRKADHVLITNCDNVVAASKLGLENYAFVPHAILEEVGVTREDEESVGNGIRLQLNSDFVVFHPARQHWSEERDPNYDKGNDILIRGFARLVPMRPRAKLVMVDWGIHAEKTKALVRDLDIEENVAWIAPEPIRKMRPYILAADVVADQFTIGAWGGIMPLAMQLGRPSLIYIDEEVHRWCFPEMPPVLNARTPDEVFERLREMLAPEKHSLLSRRSEEWYNKFHSIDVVAGRLIDSCMQAIETANRRPTPYTYSAADIDFASSAVLKESPLPVAAVGRFQARLLSDLALLRRPGGAHQVFRRLGRSLSIRTPIARVRVIGSRVRSDVALLSRPGGARQVLRRLQESVDFRVHRAIRAMQSAMRSVNDMQGSGTQQTSALEELFAVSAARLRAAVDDPNAMGIGACADGQNVLMLVVSDLSIDPRVEREARALAADGYDVHIIAPDVTGKLRDNALNWGQRITFEMLPVEASDFIIRRPGVDAGMIFDAALAWARQKAPFVVHAHDLNTSLAGLAVARQTGAHFIADFHEWTSENVHWDDQNKAWVKFPSDWKSELQAVEARILAEASTVITVCDSIAEAIAVELGNGRRPLVIRNIPAISLEPTTSYPPLKVQLGLPPEQFVLLWQGGTGATRLIEPIIESLAYAPACTFVIRGSSLDVVGDGYRAIAQRIGAADRLLLLPPVPSRDVVAAARGADAGVWTLPELCRNFTYALPNKIFEYIASGLPIVVAHYPEAKRIAQTYSVGTTFDPYDPKSIAASINRLINDPAFAQSCRENTAKALVELDADGEWRKLSALYNSLPRVDVHIKHA